MSRLRPEIVTEDDEDVPTFKVTPPSKVTTPCATGPCTPSEPPTDSLFYFRPNKDIEPLLSDRDEELHVYLSPVNEPILASKLSHPYPAFVKDEDHPALPLLYIDCPEESNSVKKNSAKRKEGIDNLSMFCNPIEEPNAAPAIFEVDDFFQQSSSNDSSKDSNHLTSKRPSAGSMRRHSFENHNLEMGHSGSRRNSFAHKVMDKLGKGHKNWDPLHVGRRCSMLSVGDLKNHHKTLSKFGSMLSLSPSAIGGRRFSFLSTKVTQV